MSAAAYTGIPLALLATTAYSVGLIQEKRALGRMPALDARRIPRLVASLLADPGWLAGFALMLTGLACQVIVLSYEPVSVVQPVLSFGVVLVLVLSRLILRERLGAAELWCVSAMAVCVILLAASTGGAGTGAGHHASPGWLAAIMIPSVVIGLLVAGTGLGARSGRHRPAATGVRYGIGTGLLYGAATLSLKALSGILTGYRTAASIGIGIVSSPYLYVLAGCLLAAMLLFQVALQSCRASILIPVSTATSSAYVLIAGTWLFHEHLPASPDKLGLRLAAIATAGFVLVMLSRQGQVPGEISGTAGPGPGPAPSYLADPRRRLWLSRTRCSTSWRAPSTSAACSTSPTTRCCTTRGCAACTGSRTASRRCWPIRPCRWRRRSTSG
jgi:multidrug transporter EmrE-like cation transporter